jgi:predicted  nucleic acid-binding Zn-ribbon protein
VDVPGRLTTDRQTEPDQEPPLKADAFSQLRLLDLQELDSRADQLRHQLASIPEAKELAALKTQRGRVDTEARDARILVEDLTREQRKADADVEQVKARRVRDQQRMDQGLVTNPKDLERMQGELVSLERRISDLEDVELDVMQRLEDAQAELDRLTADLEQMDRRASDLSAARDEKAGKLDAEVAEVAAQRKPLADGLPADLVTLYDRLRAQKGGVGAAALRARRCGGCSLELTAADLSGISKAPTDEVLRCEECNRILVRTSESGI